MAFGPLGIFGFSRSWSAGRFLEFRSSFTGADSGTGDFAFSVDITATGDFGGGDADLGFVSSLTFIFSSPFASATAGGLSGFTLGLLARSSAFFAAVFSFRYALIFIVASSSGLRSSISTPSVWHPGHVKSLSISALVMQSLQYV